MSASFAYEDPLSRASQQLGTKAQTAYMFREMGKNMWSTGKGFARVGALYSGVECCIEGVRFYPLRAHLKFTLYRNALRLADARSTEQRTT